AARRGAGLAAAGDDRALTFPGAAASRVRRCGGAAARRGSERSALRTLLQPSAARFSILVNSNMTLGRQVFTTAHELAHTFFHSRGLDVIVSMPGAELGRERFADMFAGELLVPGDELRRLVAEHTVWNGLTEPTAVVHLQRHFGVSYATIRVRLL